MMKPKALDSVAIGIKKEIIARGLVQKAVAKRAGFTEQQFSDMLNDRKIIKASDLMGIADAIGIEVIDLLKECQPSV